MKSLLAFHVQTSAGQSKSCDQSLASTVDKEGNLQMHTEGKAQGS